MSRDLWFIAGPQLSQAEGGSGSRRAGSSKDRPTLTPGPAAVMS